MIFNALIFIGLNVYKFKSLIGIMAKELGVGR
jgi:hypothetical protein